MLKLRNELVIICKESRALPLFPNWNGNFGIHRYKSKALKIYDKDFKLIKTIDKINNKTFYQTYLTSNGRDSIYSTDVIIHKIIQTDFYFHFIKTIQS